MVDDGNFREFKFQVLNLLWKGRFIDMNLEYASIFKTSETQCRSEELDWW